VRSPLAAKRAGPQQVASPATTPGGGPGLRYLGPRGLHGGVSSVGTEHTRPGGEIGPIKTYTV